MNGSGLVRELLLLVKVSYFLGHKLGHKPGTLGKNPKSMQPRTTKGLDKFFHKIKTRTFKSTEKKASKIEWGRQFIYDHYIEQYQEWCSHIRTYFKQAVVTDESMRQAGEVDPWASYGKIR